MQIKSPGFPLKAGAFLLTQIAIAGGGYSVSRGKKLAGSIPNAARIITISKMINKTRTICATGAGSGNNETNHQISPNTTR